MNAAADTGAVSAGVASSFGGAGIGVTRYGGTDRYQTSQLINAAAYPSAVGSAMLATGVDFPDSLAGAVLAILIVPSRPSRPASRWAVPRWDSWAPGWMPSMPSLTRADLYDAMDNVQRSVSRAASAAPGTFERLLEALTRVDPQGTIDKAGSWLERMQSKVKK